MAEQNSFLQENPPDEPELRRNAQEPKGVIQKNLKAMLYIGAVVVVVLALVLSSFQKAKTPGPKKQTAAQPVVQDNTASNVEALQQQVASDKARDKQDAAIAAAAGNGTPAQQVAGGSYSATGQPMSCQPGQYCPPPQGTNNNGQPPALTPVEQQEQQLAAKERERQFTSRFESNLAYNRTAMEDQQRGQMAQQQAMQPQQQNPDQQQDPYAAAFQTGAQTAVGQVVRTKTSSSAKLMTGSKPHASRNSEHSERTSNYEQISFTYRSGRHRGHHDIQCSRAIQQCGSGTGCPCRPAD
jgi:type IV secretion system protein VirB10